MTSKDPYAEFDPSLNQDYHSLYDSRSDLFQDIIGGTVASVVDFGASVWNSLTPESMEVQTEDLLANISDNALRVYEENPDTVHTASMVAGIVMPAGLTMKGLKMLRAGTKGVNWFNDAGKLAQMEKVNKLFDEGASASALYRKERNLMLARSALNETLDSFAIEGAILLAQNDHPFMEDYMKNPVKNFLLWGTAGGVLGGTVAGIADNYLMRKAAGGKATEAFGKVIDGLAAIPEGAARVDRLHGHNHNITILKSLTEGSEALTGLERDIASHILIQEQNRMQNLWKTLVPAELTAEESQALLQRFLTMPTVAQVDALSFVKLSPDGRSSAGAINKFKQLPALTKSPNFIQAMHQKLQTPYLKKQILFADGTIGTEQHLKWYAPASAIQGLTEKSLGKIGPSYLRVPNVDAGMHLAGDASARVDKTYLDALVGIDGIKIGSKDVVVLAPDDLPGIQALLARAMKDPSAFDNVQIKITRQMPRYDEYARRTFAEVGVKATHSEDILKAITEKKGGATKAIYSLNRRDETTSGLSSNAYSLLRGWISGSNIAKMRTGADTFFRGGFGSGSQVGELVAEMYHSPQSTALRAELMKHADAEGNVYLWRGMTKDSRGHSALESYTVDPVKASKHGTANLYKVHVDDVLGALTDIPDRDGIMRNEIIVGSPARQAVSDLPIGTPKAGTSQQAMTLAELSAHLASEKADLISTLAKAGLPAPAIAIRTNVPSSTVEAFLASGAKDLESLGLPWMSYTSAASVADYIKWDTRPIVLAGNIEKKPYATFLAGLQTKKSFDINQQLTEAFLSQSKSVAAQDLRTLLFDELGPILGLLRTEISQAVNQKAGWRFFQSSDFYSRDMKEFGLIANYIGKRIQKIVNDAETRLVKPLTERMNAISKEPTAIIELNTAVDLNASLKGVRTYHDRQFWQTEEAIGADGKLASIEVPVKLQGQEFKIIDDEVDALLSALGQSGRELYHLQNSINKILGKPDLHDLGYWLPAINQRNKQISYVWDKKKDTVKLLWGNTPEELAEAERVYKGAFPNDFADGSVEIIRKGEQQSLYNTLSGRADPLTATIANVEKFHGGSSTPAITRANLDVFRDIVGSYQTYINSKIRTLADLSLHDVTDMLERMSSYNQATIKGQSLDEVKAALFKPKDAAQDMRNILLGSTGVQEVPAWKKLNQSFETVLGYAITGMGQAWKAATFGKWGGKRDVIQADYSVLKKELDKRGIVNPYAVFAEAEEEIFKKAKISESADTTGRFIYASNALAATTALRFGEVAQPLVNAMSLPILTRMAITTKMPSSFLGVQRGAEKIHPNAIMYDGVRAAASNRKEWTDLAEHWESLGFFEPFVSEAQKVQGFSRTFERGVVAGMENAVESNLVRTLSKGADYSESLVRRTAMFTGAVLAKKLYPELDRNGITLFARDFMDQAIGNYHSAQRPVMFQGSLGVAMGLFQTYMLTMAQGMYRHLELRNYKELGKAMLTQATIFGAGSLPGFHFVSNAIGEHFSDDNVDLITGTFRAVSDPLASLLIYGLPSNLGPAFYSRGDIQPRVPASPMEFPAINMMTQTLGTILDVKEALSRDYPDTARALGEALSMQSMSRPLARMSELVTGYSVTRKGETISTNEEIWTPVGVMARLMSTRPLEEAKLRDAIHLDRMYKGLDHDARQKVTEALKTAIRSNSLTDERFSAMAEEYMRTGSPQGWRAAVNNAIAQSTVSGRDTLMKKLKPDNPLMFMIDSLDGSD